MVFSKFREMWRVIVTFGMWIFGYRTELQARKVLMCLCEVKKSAISVERSQRKIEELTAYRPAFEYFDEAILLYPLYKFCDREYNLPIDELPPNLPGAVVFIDNFLEDYLYTGKYLDDDYGDLDKIGYLKSVQAEQLRLYGAFHDLPYDMARFEAMLAQSQEYLNRDVVNFVFALRHLQELNRQTNTKEVVPSVEERRKRRKVQ